MRAAELLVNVRLTILTSGVIWWAAGCSDGTGAGKPLDPLAGLVVSPPVTFHAAAGIRPLAPGSSAGSVTTYVSLLPGSVPSGLTATVRDPATGASATVSVIDGGFDPVALSANVGDTLEVTITRSGSGTIMAAQAVPAGRPPVVVRSDPGPKKVDVPLNTSMLLVFSTPIDSTTLSLNTVQLYNGVAFVSGTVRLADSTGFRVEFQPSVPLDARTLYDLLVTQGLHDVNGDSLTAPLDLQFTTGNDYEPLVFSSLSVAAAYTCGVTTGGSAYCWGVNSQGELGDTSGAECGTHCSTIPLPVSGGLTFQSVSTGYYHACGVTTTGSAYCWGSAGSGLGADTSVTNACYTAGYYDGCLNPVPVMGGLTFASVSAGLNHSCGVTSGAAAYCWGLGPQGAVGADSATLATSCHTRYSSSYCRGPVPVAGGLSFASVSAGNVFTCGVTTSGAAYCWGANDAGQLGIGTPAGPETCSPTLPCSHTPVAVTGGLTFASVVVGDSTVCGLTTAGAPYCWGYNGGQFGAAAATGSVRTSPTRVAGGMTFVALTMGHDYACGVTGAGSAFCWGIGDNGVFGNGATIHYSATPLQVVGGHPFVAIGAALGLSDHSCGLALDGTAYCWGANVEGELGNGSTNNSMVPMEVLGQ